MKNSLNDLNNYLFESLERLTDDFINNLELEKELKRADMISKVAKTIIDNANVGLKIKRHLDEYNKGENYKIPGM